MKFETIVAFVSMFPIRYQSVQPKDDMRIQLLMNKIAQSLRDRGVIATLTRAGHILLSKEPQRDAFDLIRGTDTGGIDPLWKFNIDSPNASSGVRYQPSPEEAIADAIRFLNNVDPNHTTFVDLGCGKGRPLIVASELGFRQIIGVEFASELVDAAKANLSHLGIVASVYHCDAAEFEFPAEPMVVFLYNPFGPDVLARVLENLRGRAVHIIYRAPLHADILDRADFLTQFDEPPKGFMIWHSLSKAH
jgi:hypothetical protein